MRAPANAPDIVFILLDDVGFSDFGCYGSEIDTPNVDRLARGGVRHTNFHVMAMCSPTRASLLTGRNAHSVGMGIISEWAGGFPGYRGLVTRRAATVAEILRDNGYGTIAVGKWHLTPMKEVSAAGPFGNWPLGRGFDRWYGFHGAFTDQWNPELYRGQSPDRAARGRGLSPQRRPGDPGHPLRRQSQGRRARATLLPVSCLRRMPLAAPRAASARRQVQRPLRRGWDEIRKARFARQKALGAVPPAAELPSANPGVPAWDDLTEEERRFCERSQEVYAGFIDHTDQQIGRLLAFLEARGHAENTLIVLMSDNGASPEGGPLGTVALNARKHLYHGPETSEERRASVDTLGGHTSYPHYAFGWAQVSNTPLKWYKMNTYGGGVRSPLIMHWPARLSGGALQSQYHHAIDVMPTVLDVLGIEAPASYRGVPQMPVEGTSMAYTFNAADAPTRKLTQFFEMAGERAIWHRGWKAVTRHKPGADFESEPWALYHLDQDFSECRDLAQTHPEKLKQLVDLWWAEAKARQCPSSRRQWAARSNVNRGVAARRFYRFFPGLERIDRIMAPDIARRSYSISADVEFPRPVRRACSWPSAVPLPAMSST